MNHVILGMKGHVLAIDKSTGEEIWRSKLKSSEITVVSSDSERVYASASGHLFCLDRHTGEQLWVNKLKGLGYGTCVIDRGDTAAQLNSEAVAATTAASISAAATIASCSAASASAGSTSS